MSLSPNKVLIERTSEIEGETAKQKRTAAACSGEYRAHINTFNKNINSREVIPS